MAQSPFHTLHPICLVVKDIAVGEGAGVTLSIRKSPPVA